MTPIARLKLPRAGGFVPMFAVLAGGVLLLHAFAAAIVLATVLRGQGVGDWVSLYTAGTMVREGAGARLYDVAAQTSAQAALFGAALKPNAYPLPPFVALLLTPITLLSFKASFMLWLAANLALLGVLTRLAWRHLEPVRRDVRVTLTTCAALSTPVVTSLFLGQIDLFLLAAIVACYALMLRGKDFTAGAVLAFALAKPQVAAAVLLLLLLKRQWRALAGVCAVALPLFAGPMLLLGPRIMLDQIRLLAMEPGSSTEHSFNAQMMVNVRGAVVSVTGSSSVWLWGPPMLLIAAAALYAAVHAWRSRPVLDAQSWALALALPILYSPHMHLQTMVLLLGAAVLYVRARAEAANRVRPEWVLAVYAAVGILWLLSIIGISLMFLPVLLGYELIALRWPRPAAEAASPYQIQPDWDDELLAS